MLKKNCHFPRPTRHTATLNPIDARAPARLARNNKARRAPPLPPPYPAVFVLHQLSGSVRSFSVLET